MRPILLALLTLLCAACGAESESASIEVGEAESAVYSDCYIWEGHPAICQGAFPPSCDMRGAYQFTCMGKAEKQLRDILRFRCTAPYEPPNSIQPYANCDDCNPTEPDPKIWDDQWKNDFIDSRCYTPGLFGSKIECAGDHDERAAYRAGCAILTEGYVENGVNTITWAEPDYSDCVAWNTAQSYDNE